MYIESHSSRRENIIIMIFLKYYSFLRETISVHFIQGGTKTQKSTIKKSTAYFILSRKCFRKLQGLLMEVTDKKELFFSTKPFYLGTAGEPNPRAYISKHFTGAGFPFQLACPLFSPGKHWSGHICYVGSLGQIFTKGHKSPEGKSKLHSQMVKMVLH